MNLIMKKGIKQLIKRFFEPNGCYYSKDFKPKGWWVLNESKEEYFYDINGCLDGEFEGEDDSDNEVIELK